MFFAPTLSPLDLRYCYSSDYVLYLLLPTVTITFFYAPSQYFRFITDPVQLATDNPGPWNWAAKANQDFRLVTAEEIKELKAGVFDGY